MPLPIVFFLGLLPLVVLVLLGLLVGACAVYGLCWLAHRRTAIHGQDWKG